MEDTTLAFFSAHPVFSRREFQVSRGTSEDSSNDLLTYYVRKDRLKLYAPGVFAVIPPHIGPRHVPDRYLVAAKVRDTAIIAYHSALELHALAYSEGAETQLISDQRPGALETEVGRIRFVRSSDMPTDEEIEVMDREGLEVRTTTLERTIVDCFERPDLAGGLEEIAHALSAVTYVDPDAIVAMVERRQNRTLAGVVGWWLDSRSEDLMVREDVLLRLESLAPRSSPRVYAGAERGAPSVHARRWGVWLPAELATPRFEDLSSGMEM